MWNRYRLRDGLLKGLGLGVGVAYKGNRRGNTSVVDQPGLQLAPYTRWDANISYERRFRKCTMNVTGAVANLTNLEYEVNANGFAEPRAYTGSVSVRF